MLKTNKIQIVSLCLCMIFSKPRYLGITKLICFSHPDEMSFRLFYQELSDTNKKSNMAQPAKAKTITDNIRDNAETQGSDHPTVVEIPCFWGICWACQTMLCFEVYGEREFLARCYTCRPLPDRMPLMLRRLQD